MRKPKLPGFIEFGILPDDYALLLLLPVFGVAWADGKIQPQEVNNLLAAANTFASLGVDPQHPKVQQWMKDPIHYEEAEKAIHFLNDLAFHEDFSEITATRVEDVVRICEQVAKSAGGFLGFAAVSGKEAKLIKGLQQIVDNIKRARGH